MVDDAAIQVQQETQRRLSVLVVDDSPVMRSFIKRVLALSGVPTTEIHEAGDGACALELLGRSPVDLVLSDINMPNMNGSELMRRMKAAPSLSTIPVIVISTDSSHLRVESMLELGARGYIHKPFQPESLRAEIERVLEL
jgi:two-component system chemotaxis response regulator CheY